MSEISADNNMERPIDSLLWATASLIERIIKYADLDDDALASDSFARIADVDEQMRVAYMTALRLRAKEVCEYAERVGLTGCTVERVKENPFLVALAMRRVGRV